MLVIVDIFFGCFALDDCVFCLVWEVVVFHLLSSAGRGLILDGVVRLSWWLCGLFFVWVV